MKRLLVLLVAFALAGLAADLNGTWKVKAEGPNGAMERTFTFKAEGSKLTGETVSSMMGKSTIENGKIDGDNFTFTIAVRFQDNEMKVSYKGTVSGDNIKMTARVADMDNTIEWSGSRAK
jgi:hypothetical protein